MTKKHKLDNEVGSAVPGDPPYNEGMSPLGRPSGFTLLELLVVLSIVAVLSCLLLPAVRTVREQARAMRCQSNLRQVYLACSAYCQDNGAYPDTASTEYKWWYAGIEPYLDAEGDSGGVQSIDSLRAARGVLRSCPAWPHSIYYALEQGKSINASNKDGAWNTGYGMNCYPFRPESMHTNASSSGWGQPYKVAMPTNVTCQSARALIGDAPDYYIWSSFMLPGGRDDRRRHGGRCNFVFFDGHVASLAPEQVQWALDDPARYTN